jgi:hypothetical protein
MMNREFDDSEQASIRSRTVGALSGAALLLAYAALDDITTDHAKTFAAEYTALIACAGWLVFAAFYFLRRPQRLRGSEPTSDPE